MAAVVVRLHDKKKPPPTRKPPRPRKKPLGLRDPDLDDLLPRIERHMKAKKLSIMDMAVAAESSTSMVYNWLNHVTRHPSHIKMATVARAIGMEYRLVNRDE